MTADFDSVVKALETLDEERAVLADITKLVQQQQRTKLDLTPS